MRAATLALALAALFATPAGAAALPGVTPPVRSFAPAGGTVVLGPGARVVGGGAEGRTLARDLGLRTARRARAGDVVLARAGGRLAPEGYVLRVGPRALRIEASTAAGWFYGGRTLLALRGRPIPRGVVRDAPAYRERGLMIDVGRRFYPRAWLLARIRDLADLKLNLLHLHLSDDQGFSVASRSHPEIVSAQHLTVADVRALEREAARRHVTIVPEIDMPGHMTAALARHPELQLADALGNRSPDKLDVTLPAAREFAREIVADQLTLWRGPFWHAGADEYLGAFSTAADYQRFPQLAAYAQGKYGPSANGHDAVQDFVNELGEQVRAAGRRLRVWSDGMAGGSAVRLLPGTTVEWWENRVSPRPQQLVKDGYDVLNVGWWPLYYVNGGTFGSLRASESDLRDRWDPWHFEGPYTPRWTGGPPVYDELARDEPRQTGAMLAVWNDDPQNPGGAPGTLERGIAPRLAILAAKTWSARR